MKRFNRNSFVLMLFVAIGCLILSHSSSIAGVTVNILGPPDSEPVLANSRCSFLIFLTNNGSDIASAETSLSISVSGASFVSSTGTSEAHFPLRPETGTSPLVYQSTDTFYQDASRIAVLTLETDSSGTLSINASAQVEDMSAVANLSCPITQDLGFADPSMAFYELAFARQSMAATYIQMYKNYMATGNLYAEGGSRDDLGNELAELTRWSGTIISATSTLTNLAQNPGVALYGVFLDLAGMAAGQPNLMDVLELIDYAGTLSFMQLYHYFYGEGEILVQLEGDADSGLMDRLWKLQGDEAAAWYNGWIDSANAPNLSVLDALDQQQAVLLIIKKCAQDVADAVYTDHDGARAFFNMISDYATAELQAVQYIRANAVLAVNHAPVFSSEPVFPAHNAAGVDINSDLQWQCSDEDANSIVYDVYLKKQTDSVFIKCTPASTAATAYDPGQLEPAVTYNWYVEARDTDIGPYADEGSVVTSPVWTFTTAADPVATIDLLYVPDYAQTETPIDVDAVVTVSGATAQLRFELREGTSLIRTLSEQTISGSDNPQHISFVFSQPTPIYATVKAVLSIGGTTVDSKSAAVNIVSSSNGFPSLVEIQVEGIMQDGAPYLYDSGPVNIHFLACDDADPTDIQCWTKYAFSETAPADWYDFTETELVYQGTETYNVTEPGKEPYSITVSRHTLTIPSEQFGPLADGSKTLWIQPTKLTNTLCVISGMDSVFHVSEHPVRDDDTLAPKVVFEGQAADGTPCYMILTPRRLDYNIRVSDTMVLLQDGTIEQYSSGISETTFGYVVTEEQPSALDDADFTVYHTQAYAQGFYHSGYMNIPSSYETRWLTMRVVAAEADDDWTGDGHIVRRDWTARIPDDDASGPEITSMVFPSLAEYSTAIRVSCDIKDASGLAVNSGNGKKEARLYYSYDKSNWFGPLYWTSVTDNVTYHFDIPPAGGEHIGTSLYFYVEATDADNDREGDAAITVENNSGLYHAVGIVDTDFPSIENISITDGQVVSGNLVISADVQDGSGDADVTVKINGNIVANSLPFAWNTSIASWSGPATVATDAETWETPCMVSGGGNELWVVYLKNDGNLYIRHSLDGINWASPVQAAAAQDTIMRPALLRDSAGTLRIAYQDYDSNWNMSLFVVSSVDNGQTWSAPVQATTGIDVVGRSLIQDSNNRYWYAFYSYDENWNNIICVTGSVNGTDWSQPVTVDPNTAYDLDYMLPLISESPSGQLYVHYQKYEFAGGQMLYTPVQSTSADGTSWSAPSPVSFGWDGSYHELLSMEKDRNGTYWLSYIHDGFTRLLPSADLNSWGVPVTVSDTAMGIDIAQTADGTYWFVCRQENELMLFHSVTESVYTITIEASDASGNAVSCAVNVTLAPTSPANHTPVADSQNLVTDQYTSISITLTGSDADDDDLVYSLLSQPVHGTLYGTAPELMYTPDKDYEGTDSFTFKVNDGQTDSSAATVTIQINHEVVCGDINDNGAVDLGDVILSLQVSSGMNPAGIRLDYPLSGADVNADARIGLEETVFDIQKISGLK